jgi:hypothetical protein
VTDSARLNLIHPDGMDACDRYRVTIDGRDAFVYTMPVASYVPAEIAGAVTVRIETTKPFSAVKVRPLSAGLEPRIDGQVVTLEIDSPGYYSVEFDDELTRPLLLFFDKPLTDAPDPEADDVIYFAPGKVHEAGVIKPTDGQTVYIPAGAVVRGRIEIVEAKNVRVCGRGVLDGSVWWPRDRPRPRMILLHDCRDAVIEGVVLHHSPGWSCVPVGCGGVEIENVKILTQGVGGDGFDLVGCQDVTIRHCFARTNDDCVAIKASTFRHDFGGRDIRDILVEGCVFWNAHAGNVVEIGYETMCEEIRDVTFRDIDVIHAEYEGYQSGGVLTIHCGDRADVHDIIYDDIRVEDAREKLIDFKVLLAKYSRDADRGKVHDILVRDVRVIDGPVPVSIIRGFERERDENRNARESLIRNVNIEGLSFHGRPIDNWRDARMVLELAQNVTFAPL